ncbi:SDR family NAD(P)-dependent oxidoreductase [Nonomuraea sp. NPDC059023]|uniref:SDR family NAD(P)-dependent oxidoreductase n=1 Tax=unclassified Nonomuraea TaxID=2593643 RepID=UPI0036891F78
MSDRIHVVVIGGTSGIGRHAAESFAARGCEVVITGRTEHRAKEIAGQIGSQARGLALDLTVPEQIAPALGSVRRVDRLVLAALERDHNTVREYRPADAARMLTMKLVGYTVVVHALVSRMSGDSSAVLLGGLAMHRPYPGSTSVTTANGGVAALVRTLVTELAPIRFNALHPSLVADTPYWSDKPHVWEAVKARTPTGRLVTMRDCTEAITFLLENRSINGVNLSIDGGELLV